jgi:hypothetical protein
MFSAAIPLVIAGGGGGGGGQNLHAAAAGGNGGGSADVDGRSGHPEGHGYEGHGGTTRAGGAGGGLAGCTFPATSGEQFQGGNSNTGYCVSAGGGGGGGYFGGGGGAEGSGGGGGSAYPSATSVVQGITITPNTSVHGLNSRNGKLMISYNS